MIYDDYMNYCKEYETLYGKDTVVLMEVGGFYELYGVNYNNTLSGADIYNVAALLGIQVSRKNKNIIENSFSNPLMAGFPSYTLHKFIDILVANNKTVVLVEQTTSPPNPKREVTRIISPATYEEKIYTNTATNYIMHLYLDSYNSGNSLAVGIACIDCSTGKTYVEEIHDVKDKNMTYEELQKLLIFINPKEVILSSTANNVLSVDEEMLLQLFNDVKIYNKINMLTCDYTKMCFQESVLTTHYFNNTQLSIFEFLNIERKLLGSISFAYLLHFAHQHNPSHILNVYSPLPIETENKLKIAHNAPEQLNITSGSVSVLDLLNTCVTSIGKRYFRNRLLNPSSDKDVISASYSKINVFARYDTCAIRNELKNVKDVEKIIHKPSSKIHPYDILSIFNSISSIQTISSMMNDDNDNLRTYLSSVFCFDDVNIFNTLSGALFSELDEIKPYEAIIVRSKETFNDALEGFKLLSDHFKLEHNDRDGWHIVCSVKRLEQCLKTNKKMFEGCSYSHNKTASKIFIKNEKQLNEEICKANHEINKIVQNKYYDVVDFIKTTYKKQLEYLVVAIESIDFYSTCVHNNHVFKLCAPDISMGAEAASHVDAKGLRHIIIENINKNIEYVSNDITLNKNGIILYGINASGKSSLMKSIGIALIMAQAGMFVPAFSFAFHPYTSIYTRITGNDNLYKSQSTFVLEMAELRTILQCADDKSLIIGDELCSGTETISAVSIVAAGIQILAQKNAAFIFTTHLHELQKHVKQSNVAMYHLSVSYDNDKIIYDRKLKKGIGNTLYGLEVCKSLDMGDMFMKVAFDIRNEYIQSNAHDNHSHYNKNVVKNMCSVCKENRASDVHHIKEQHTADADGYIGVHHKNDAHNLVALCKECHDSVHANKLIIDGYRMTSVGRELFFKHQVQTFDFNDEEVVECVLKTRKHNSLQSTLEILQKTYPVAQFTAYRINKILHGNVFK
jgi:DNA mismatch repair protein MutS